jgi:hypothetical protein
MNQRKILSQLNIHNGKIIIKKLSFPISIKLYQTIQDASIRSTKFKWYDLNEIILLNNSRQIHITRHNSNSIGSFIVKKHLSNSTTYCYTDLDFIEVLTTK